MSAAISLDIASLQRAYGEGRLDPVALVDTLCQRMTDDRSHAWIHRIPHDALLARARALQAQGPQGLPLYGIPFAIKDNIDLAGVPTTAGCPAFAYTPQHSATVVQKLLDAGAIALGKTNLDQFATGLNGTRSPYGACQNAFDPSFISGGSSSGSAVVVARGWASFALGTDTAGSGRVPAAFNNIVGHKPTRGWLSTHGVVPACRSLDCVSVFALDCDDVQRVLAVAQGHDAQDIYSRPARPHGFDFGSAGRWRLGVPRADQLECFGDPHTPTLFSQAIDRARQLGAEVVELNFAPLLEAAGLLYDGPWVAERYHRLREFMAEYSDDMWPVTRDITLAATRFSAVDTFDAIYRLRALRQRCNVLWQQVDAMLTPTAGTIYRIADMQADPVRLNSRLGHYTNFMNLLDYAALALPAGFRPDGLPFGVTFFAPAHQDVPLLHLGRRWQAASALPAGATGQRLPAHPPSPPAQVSGQVRVAVCGAHLSGLPLNGQLTSRGARLIGAHASAPKYRFYALAGGPPKRPGMVRVATGGASIDMEIWELPAHEFGSFVAGIPSPLGIGTVELADGSCVQGFVCESWAVAEAEDITAFGSWRRYLASRNG